MASPAVIRFLGLGAVAFALSLSTEGARAQSAAAFHGGLGFSSTGVDPQAAKDNGINSRGYGMQASTELRWHQITAARLEFGAEYLAPLCLQTSSSGSDHCRPDDQVAATFALFGSTALGLWMPSVAMPGEHRWRIAAGVFGGREWVNAGVGEGRCLNCSVDVDLVGGYFVEPALEFSYGHRETLGMYYRIFEQASDLTGRLTIRYLHSSQ